MQPSDLIRSWFAEVWNAQQPDMMEKFVTEETLFYSVNETGGPLKGASGFRPFIKRLLAAFPDIKFTVEHTIDKGEYGVGRWVAHMTHTGDGLGVPPTNKDIVLTGMVIVRIADGKIVETWDEWDRFGMLRAIGAISLAPATQAAIAAE